ncbi:MAG: hypothetical protein HKN67_09895 [Saprospiraceae bacterium]|nr:hypothetical protein [Saprospiraceae bacterium]
MNTKRIIKSILGICIFTLLSLFVKAQDAGYFSGGFQSSANFFLRDSAIGAANIPQYDNELFGAQAWLDLGYNINGFDLGLRFDMFNNSNLLNPNDSYTEEGIGRWHIAKKLDKLDIRIGHIYDQIGSGIIYRAFEERPLLIDNALYGARLVYDLSDNWQVKGFTGRQRFLFDEYDSVIKGASIEGFIDLSSEDKMFTLAPGFGIVNNTLDEESVNSVVDIVKTYQPVDRVEPKYNTFAYSLFNTLSYGPVSWYAEYALKSSEIFYDPNAIRTEASGAQTFGKLVKDSGSVIYSSLSYAGHGLGVTLEMKRTENFDYRANPNLRLLRGLINFIPPMNRQNTYRLNTRYSPATQLLSEQAYQVDVKYRWNKSLTTSVNFSNIEDLDGKQLYQELFTEVFYKYKRKWQIKTGVQFQKYNQEVYEVKPGVPLVENVVPYIDFLYKISRKNSIRVETQFMSIGDDEKAGYKQDYGNWFFVLVEYAMAPHWSFVVSDMYNTSPGKNSAENASGEKEKLHFPRIDIYYTHKANRFSVSYIKQVEGIVCNGGICRLEPAFSGFNFSVSSSF